MEGGGAGAQGGEQQQSSDDTESRARLKEGERGGGREGSAAENAVSLQGMASGSKLDEGANSEQTRNLQTRDAIWDLLDPSGTEIPLQMERRQA